MILEIYNKEETLPERLTEPEAGEEQLNLLA